jgi:MFS family permease
LQHVDEALVPAAAVREAERQAPPESDPEVAYERFVVANLPRNFAAHYLHGMLGMTGFRLVNAPTFVPAYLHTLSGSDALVGLGLALQQLGGAVSPIVGASHIEHRKRVMPIAMWMGSLMRLSVLGLALSGFWVSGTPLLLLVVLFLFLLGLFSGAQRVAFQFLLAKVIPIDRRGRLQAWRNTTGGLISAGLAYVAGRHLIEGRVWGNGYATTFLLAFVLTSLGLTALRLLMREPEPPTLRARSGFRKRLRELPALMRESPDYAYFTLALAFAMAGRIATPFYILYASATIPLTGANIGLLSLAYLGADTLSNLVWGYAGDRFGFRASFIASLVVGVGSTLLFMSSAQVATIFLAFAGLGAAQAGGMMSASTLVLEFGGREDMAMRLAVSTTVEGVMATLGPLLGGVLAASLGYRALFSTSIVCGLLALLVLLAFVADPSAARRRAAARA